MPKRVGFLYEQMVDKDNIRLAIRRGAKGKRKRWDVKDVVAREDVYVEKIHNLIATDSFVPTKPKQRDVYDPSSQKWRKINVVPFYPDGIMHQLIVLVMEPVLMRGMHPWSCASIPGRGGKRALRRAEHIIRDDRKGSKYGGELDVKGFYPSVPLRRLMCALSRKIKDRKFLLLIAVVLTCYPGGFGAALQQGERAETIVGDARGLLIGFYVCQWLANYYLEALDHFTMAQPGVKYMVRYMDNISIWGPNKKALHKARRAIAECMEKRLGLVMKSTWQIFPVAKRLFSIVGYRVARGYTILRKRNFLRFTRQCRKAQKYIEEDRHIPYKMAAGLLSRIGQLKHCDSHNVRVKYVDPIGVKILKEVVKNEGKRRPDAEQRFLYGRAAQSPRLCAGSLL